VFEVDKWFLIALGGYFFSGAIFFLIHLFIGTCYCVHEGNYWHILPAYPSDIHSTYDIPYYTGNPYCPKHPGWAFISLLVIEVINI
jgi:hypothetical protein